MRSVTKTELSKTSHSGNCVLSNSFTKRENLLDLFHKNERGKKNSRLNTKRTTHFSNSKSILQIRCYQNDSSLYEAAKKVLY